MQLAIGDELFQITVDAGSRDRLIAEVTSGEDPTYDIGLSQNAKLYFTLLTHQDAATPKLSLDRLVRECGWQADEDAIDNLLSYLRMLLEGEYINCEFKPLLFRAIQLQNEERWRKQAGQPKLLK